MASKSHIADRGESFELPLLSFSLPALVDDIVREKFSGMSKVPAVVFRRMTRMAFCEPRTGGQPLVVLNAELNHGETPREVVEAIVIHEILHLVVPGAEVEGRFTFHPPTFFEKERQLCPQVSLVWAWLKLTFGDDLIIDREKEQTRLKARRRRNQHFIPFSQLGSLLNEVTDDGPAECF